MGSCHSKYMRTPLHAGLDLGMIGRAEDRESFSSGIRVFSGPNCKRMGDCLGGQKNPTKCSLKNADPTKNAGLEFKSLNSPKVQPVMLLNFLLYSCLTIYF